MKATVDCQMSNYVNMLLLTSRKQRDTVEYIYFNCHRSYILRFLTKVKVLYIF